jgi:subtilisin family serine protease
MGWDRAAAAAAAAAICATSGAAVASARAASTAAWAASPHSVVVGFRAKADLARALHGLPVTVVRRVRALHVAELRTRAPAQLVADRLAARTGVLYAQPVAPRAPQDEPGLYAGAQSGLEWQFAAAGEDSVPDWVLRAAGSITIGVVDTGADLTAPDLAAKTPATYDVLTHTGDVRDLNGHGTFVASLAGGSVTNGDGMAGFGGDARLFVVRAGRPDGTFTDVDEAAGIVYAVDHGAKIVNLSLGGPTTSATEERAIAYAAEHDVLVVAAAGNERQQGNPVEYPAALLQPDGPGGPGTIGLAVAASTPDGGHAAFSNTGSYVSVAAPGVNVFGAVASTSSAATFPRAALPGAHAGLYGYASGTSFSSPEVAGAAALVWAANPSLRAPDVARILEQTASGLGSWAPDLGYGIVNAAAAVSKASGVAPVLVSSVVSRNRVHLTWSGPAAASYRVSMSQDAGPEHVVIASTTSTDSWFKLAAGHRYTFTVGAFDANGVETGVSAPASVHVARAPSSLSLAAKRRHRNRRARRFDFTAVLRSTEQGVPTAARPVLLQVLQDGAWRSAGSASTGADGHASWSLALRPGAYSVRAVFGGDAELTRTESRPLRLVVR